MGAMSSHAPSFSPGEIGICGSELSLADPEVSTAPVGLIYFRTVTDTSPSI